MTTFSESSSNNSSPITAETSGKQEHNQPMEICWFLVKIERPSIHYTLGNNAVQSSDELSGMIEIKNMAQVKEPLYQGSNHSSGDDGSNCTSAKIKALRFENGDYYIDTWDGAKYTTNKECIAYAQQLKEYWISYLSQLCADVNKPLFELPENATYFWVGGQKPKNIPADYGMIIDAVDIEPGMQIRICADSCIEVDEYCERQPNFETVVTVGGIFVDGKTHFIEAEDSLFYNVRGISRTISQELQSMGHEFHTPSFEVDEREI